MAIKEGPLRQDTRSITVTIYKPGTDTVMMKGVWDKKDGGEMDSEETLYHPGDMAQAESLGGRQNPGNLTLTRLCKLQRDWALLPAMLRSAGKARVTVADTPLDFAGNVAGQALVWTGTLKRVTPPPADSESSGPALVEIEITTDGAAN